MVKDGIGISCKSFGTAFSRKICNSNLQQNNEFQVSTYSSKQSDHLKLHLENRGTKSQEPQTVSKEIWEHFFIYQNTVTPEYLLSCLDHQAD